jgi:hypothetical protein
MEHTAKAVPALVQVELHRTLTDLQGVGDLGNAEVADIEQRHCQALLLGQRGQQGRDIGAVRLFHRVATGIGCQAFDGPFLAATAAVVVAQAVDGDSADPTHGVVVPVDPAPV